MGLKKIGLVIGILLVVGVIGFYFLKGGNFSSDKETPKETGPKPENVGNSEPVSGSNQVKTTGSILYDESFSILQLPHVISYDISYPSRLLVEFTADSPITFIMYDKVHYDEWLDGIYGSTKAGTDWGTISDSGSYKVDINIGEGGTYYFVFDSKWIGSNPSPASGTLKITELSRLG